MSVVGTHRNRNFTALLQLEESLHYMKHVNVAFQVVGFIKISFRITLRTAQVYEVDTVAELLHQGGTIVGTAHTQ